MNIVGETFLRHCLKPRVECDLPGRLRMRFRHSEQLSKEALPYLHYVQDVLTMLPGVTDVTVNARIGTALVLYDAPDDQQPPDSALGGYRCGHRT